MTDILWLSSYPKSGNTWLRVFLANWFHGPVGINDLKSAGMTLQDTRPALWRLYGEDIDDERQLEIRAEVLRTMARRPGTSFVKTHCAVGEFKGHPMLPLDVTRGAIHVVRDPRDVCLSFARHFNVTVDKAIRCMADPEQVLRDNGIVQYASDWSRHVNSWGWACVIRHEDMLERPREAFGRVLDYLGLPMDDRLDQAIEWSSFGQLKAQEREHGFKEAKNGIFFSDGRSTWRQRLSKSQVKKIERRHGGMMRLLGYL